MLYCVFTTPYTLFYFPTPSFSSGDNIYCLTLLMYIIIVHSFVQNVMEKKGTSDMFSH